MTLSDTRPALRSKPAALPDYAIELERLTKTYPASGKMGTKQALKGVDLKVPRGQIFGLLGPNGAGKSTLINILAGLVLKTSGSAKVWGHDVTTAAMSARGAIGVVPQEVTMDPFFTPIEALELQAGFYGLRPQERRTQAILEAVGLWDKRDAYVRQLSGGMKRRLMVAKALAHSPPVLVLDEPTAGVDVDLRRQLWSYVRNLNAQGVTVVLTTHYLEEAQELCDTIAIINHGEVVACEPTGDLLKRLNYRTLVVEPAQALAAVPASLAGLDAEVRKDGALAIRFARQNGAIETLLDQVKAAGIGLRDIRLEEPDLEDVFLALTTDEAR
jgi:ABC-2 type transport system ATP-binding protein